MTGWMRSTTFTPRGRGTTHYRQAHARAKRLSWGRRSGGETSEGRTDWLAIGARGEELLHHSHESELGRQIKRGGMRSTKSKHTGVGLLAYGAQSGGLKPSLIHTLRRNVCIV